MLERLRSLLARRRRRKVLDAHLAALEQERFRGFRCVVQAGLSRIFLGRDDGGRVEIRVPADFVFDPHLAAGDGASSWLSEAGFTLRPASSGLEWFRRADRGVADVEEVLFEGLGISPGIQYSVAVEPDRSADNPELRRAMRELAERSSHDARRGVYGALLDATLLLAVERSGGVVRAFPDLEDLGGRPTWLAFSGAEAAEKHERASETVSLSGVRLVRAALHQEIGALRLDFGSPVGGELYANELRSIAESVPAARPPAA